MTRSLGTTAAPRRLSPSLLGECQGDCRLGKFRRLQVERTEIDPASRAAAHDAEKEHENQQGNDAQVRMKCDLFASERVVNQRAHHQRDQADGDAAGIT